MDNLKVLIVDSKDRAESIAYWANLELGVECVLSRQSIAYDSARWVVYLHRNDVVSVQDVDGVKKVMLHKAISPHLKGIIERAEIVIGYTGGSGGLVHSTFLKEAEECGFTFDRQKWFVIGRSIEGEESEEFGLREVMRWANSSDRSNDFFPDFLRHEPNFDYLFTLSILCQGCLAQYAINHRTGDSVECNGLTGVCDALYEMGWVVEKEATKLNPDVNRLGLATKRDLPGINHWIGPFGDVESLRGKIEGEFATLQSDPDCNVCKSEPSLLVTENKEKPKLPEAIEVLLKSIEDSVVSDNNFVSVVAVAYLTLTRNLGTVEC